MEQDLENSQYPISNAPNSRTKDKAGEGRFFKFAALPPPILLLEITNTFLKVLTMESQVELNALSVCN